MNKLLILLLFSTNFLLAQKIEVKYPSSGNAIIKRKIKDGSSKDTAVDVLNVKYYYDNNILIYYLKNVDPNYERIKILNKQYDVFIKEKTYLFKDTVVDTSFGDLFIRNFIDSMYLNRSLGNLKLNETAITLNEKKYKKVSYTEYIDSINVIGSNEKIPYKSTSTGEFVLDAETKNMRFVSELYSSVDDRYYCYQELLLLKEEPKTDIQNFINDRLIEINKDFRNKTDDINITTTVNTKVTKKDVKDLKFNLLNGKQISFSNIKQQYILIDFWFPSCFPCIKSFPMLNKINDSLGIRIKVIGVNPQKTDNQFMVKFCKEKKLNYSIALDYNKKINNLFNVFIFPTWVLIDKSGEIIDFGEGYDSKLYERIKGKITPNLK